MIPLVLWMLVMAQAQLLTLRIFPLLVLAGALPSPP